MQLSYTITSFDLILVWFFTIFYTHLVIVVRWNKSFASSSNSFLIINEDLKPKATNRIVKVFYRSGNSVASFFKITKNLKQIAIYNKVLREIISECELNRIHKDYLDDLKSVVDFQHLLHSYLLASYDKFKVPSWLVDKWIIYLNEKIVQICTGPSFLYNRSKYIIRRKQSLNKIQSIEKSIQNVLAFLLR